MNFACARLQHWLSASVGVDGFLVTKKENIFWLTGFSGSTGLYLQLGTKSPSNSPFIKGGGSAGSSFLITDGRYAERAKELANENEMEFVLLDNDFRENFGEKIKGTFAGEDSMSLSQLERIKRLFPRVKFNPQKKALEHLRRQKNLEELKLIRVAQGHVNQLLHPFLKANIKEGMTEKELAFGLETALRNKGEFDLSFPAIVAFNSNSAIPHHEPNETKLRIGDNILIDCGVKYQGYCSDVTRNFAFRGASREYQKAYQDLLQVQEKSLLEFVPNKKVREIDEFVRRELGPNEAFFTHSLGHGVGLEVHELPMIIGVRTQDKKSSNSETVLQENEVVTSEPGIYFPNKFGIRIEDLLVIRKDKPEILSTLTKDLVVL